MSIPRNAMSMHGVDVEKVMQTMALLADDHQVLVRVTQTRADGMWTARSEVAVTVGGVRVAANAMTLRAALAELGAQLRRSPRPVVSARRVEEHRAIEPGS